MKCSNNLKQLGLALHNYHDSRKGIPANMNGPAITNVWGCWSAQLILMPYMEQSARYDLITTPTDATTNPPTYVWIDAQWTVSADQGLISAFACPSDGNSSTPSHRGNAVRISYHPSVGDTIMNLYESSTGSNSKNNRGFFAGQHKYNNFGSIADGLSNTIAMSEAVVAARAGDNSVKGGIAINTSLIPSVIKNIPNPQNRTIFNDTPSDPGRGCVFADGRFVVNSFQTILPPNSPSSAISTSHTEPGFRSASSFHTGGVNVLLGDDSVHFISETVESGDLSFDVENVTADQIAKGYASDGREPTGFSPFGVWGRLGTIKGGESVSIP